MLNFINLDYEQLLFVALTLLVALSSLLFKYDHLVAPRLLLESCVYTSVGYVWSADRCVILSAYY